AGIVDQAVDAAEMRDRLFDGGGAGCGILDVGDNREQSRGVVRRGQFFQRVGIAVERGDRMAVGEQRGGHHRADAAGCSGDEDDAGFGFSHAWITTVAAKAQSAPRPWQAWTGSATAFTGSSRRTSAPLWRRPTA